MDAFFAGKCNLNVSEAIQAYNIVKDQTTCFVIKPHLKHGEKSLTRFSADEVNE